MNARLDRAQPYTLGLFRIVVGLLFACHGAASVFGIFGMPALHAFSWPGWFAAVIQLVGGMLVLVGFGTRSASLLSSGSMAFAYFTVHLPHGILPLDNGGEEAAYFCWAFLLLAFTGPGTLSLSGLLTRGEGSSPRPPQPIS